MTDKPGRLVIRESPRHHWIPGTLLAAAGACGLAVAAGLVRGAMPGTVPFRLAAGVVGSLALALGTWVWWRPPAALVVDRVNQTVTLTRRGWFRTIAEQYPAESIVDARVTKERDDRGRPRYHVELVLDSGSVVPVSLSRPHDRDLCMRAAEHLWKALGLPRA
jgi:hypothetical protein